MHTSVRPDLDAAIEAQRAAFAAPAPDDDRAGLLADLGEQLRTRFEETGSRADLDEAVAASGDALAATPPRLDRQNRST